MLELTSRTEDVGSAKDSIGILRDNHSKYAAGIDPATLRRIETITKTQMDAYGYDAINEISREKRLNILEDTLYRYGDYISILNRERRIRGTLATIRSFAWKRLIRR